jgi:hypothetical protein
LNFCCFRVIEGDVDLAVLSRENDLTLLEGSQSERLSGLLRFHDQMTQSRNGLSETELAEMSPWEGLS